MKTFLTTPLKAAVAIAALGLLSAAKPAPAPAPQAEPATQDAAYEKNVCEAAPEDPASGKRTRLIRGML